MKRRDFIKHISSASLVMLGGNVINLSPADVDRREENFPLCFVHVPGGNGFHFLPPTLFQIEQFGNPRHL